MTNNAYLEIAQQKGLIDQDDYQGWRLTGKGERFLAAMMEEDAYEPYNKALDKLYWDLRRRHDWNLSTWIEACLNGHPNRVRVSVKDGLPFTYWVDVALVLNEDYDMAVIIAGQYEAEVRRKAEGEC